MNSVHTPFDRFDEATAELTLELPGREDTFPEEAASASAPPRVTAHSPALAPGRAPLREAATQAQAAGERRRPEGVLCGRYILEEPVGFGGTSVVFRARDLRREEDGAGERRIALKTLRPELHAHPQAIERLKREFRLAQALTHPHVVRVFDLDCEDDYWFMTMELLEGCTLAAALAQSPFSSGEPPFNPRRASQILRACGEALAFAHDRGVVHGDFKPGNVFLPVSGPLRVLDFGAATSVGPTLEPHLPAATVCYASPQVLSGQRPDRRDDVFSFACVAYELLSGTHPFERRSALEARETGWTLMRSWNLPERQWYALEEALNLEREARPGNIRKLLADLFPAVFTDRAEAPERIDLGEAAFTPAPSRALTPIPVSPDPAPRAPARKRGMATALLATLALVGAAGLVYQKLKNDPEGSAHLRARTVGLWQQLSAHVRSRLRAPEPPAHGPALGEQGLAPAAGADPSAQTAPPAVPEEVPAAAPSATEPSTGPAPPPVAARPAPPEIFVHFAEGRVVVSEGADAAVLILGRSRNLAGRTHVHWRAVAGTAREGDDFVPNASGRAEFADGQTTRSVYVPLLRDAIAEPEEDFFVELYDPGPRTQIWPTARARVIVRDDD